MAPLQLPSWTFSTIPESEVKPTFNFWLNVTVVSSSFRSSSASASKVFPSGQVTVNSDVIDIGQYIRAKSDAEIEEVSWHPQMEGIDKLLLTAMECAIIGLRTVNELFSLGVAGEIEEYFQRYHELAKKLTTDEID